MRPSFPLSFRPVRCRPGGRLLLGVPWLRSWVAVTSLGAPEGVLAPCRWVLPSIAAPRGRYRNSGPVGPLPWLGPESAASVQTPEEVLPLAPNRGFRRSSGPAKLCCRGLGHERSLSGSSLPKESVAAQGVVHGPSSWFWVD